MEINTIDAVLLGKMFLSGAKNLDAKKEWINELNVFPVPDGDTGTNMSMTIMAAAKEVSSLTVPNMKSMAKAISSGSLRGARGNSGVILSQLFRGFSKGISDYEQLDIVILADAFSKAVDTAYKAVMKPKEGTILTVARAASDKALELLSTTEDLVVFFDEIIQYADYVLSQTPEMLPVLKQAGVVDSGGQGLIEVLKGAYDALLGKEIDYSIEVSELKSPVRISPETEEEIKFGYCTEFILVLKEEKHFMDQEEQGFKDYLESIGDSIVVVSDEDLVKVHVHTNDPGCVLTKALSFGSLSKIKIDNMREEHQEKLIKNSQQKAKQQMEAEQQRREKATAKQSKKNKKYGFISVSIGAGINRIFKDLNVDYLVEGGQTMNPSTEDMLNAIEEVNADHIFILPNNKNIILAANQAASLTEHKHIMVIPTKTIPQGIAALINFIPEKDVKENEEAMLREINHVKTGQVTYAIRDTLIDDKEIKQGDFMGIGDTKILSVNSQMETVARDMIAQLIDEDSSIISIYYGAEVEEAQAKALEAYLLSEYEDCDIEIHYGGQPIYYYIISVE